IRSASAAVIATAPDERKGALQPEVACRSPQRAGRSTRGGDDGVRRGHAKRPRHRLPGAFQMRTRYGLCDPRLEITHFENLMTAGLQKPCHVGIVREPQLVG